MDVAAGPSTSSVSTGMCKQCGGRLVEDSSGSMDMLLCESCGAVHNDVRLVSGDTEVEDMPDKRGYQPSFGVLSQKVEGRSDSLKRREARFIHIIEQMASDTRLNSGELKICKEEGRALLKRKERFHTMKRFAAGLVFLAVKRQSPSATFKEVSQLTHVDQKILGRVVKWLKKLPSVTAPVQVRTNEQRIQEILDRLDVPKQNEIQAKKIVLDLKRVCCGTTGQDIVNEFSERTENGSFVVIALNHVYRDKRPPDTAWSTAVARVLQLKMTSMQSRLSECKHKLISVATNVPSLESRIKSKAINPRNIDKYLHYILENKDYLSSLSASSKLSSQDPTPNESLNEYSDSPDDILQVAENSEPGEPHLPPIYHPATRRTHRRMQRKKEAEALSNSDRDRDGESDSFSELDDKEIDKYIATKKEVRKKKRYFKKHDIE